MTGLAAPAPADPCSPTPQPADQTRLHLSENPQPSAAPTEHRVLVYIDGSSLRNPGPAGIGVLFIRPDGQVMKEISHSIGVATNNQAEYEALLCALRELTRSDIRAAEVRTDSQLLYCQVTGRFRVRNPSLRDRHERAMALLSRLPGVRFALVNRDENSVADKLARAASAAAAKALPNGAT